jgi:HEAT repeat protein/energy-coupling factor transporter ATP-binding protein EcfA2
MANGSLEIINTIASVGQLLFAAGVQTHVHKGWKKLLGDDTYGLRNEAARRVWQKTQDGVLQQFSATLDEQKAAQTVLELLSRDKTTISVALNEALKHIFWSEDESTRTLEDVLSHNIQWEGVWNGTSEVPRKLLTTNILSRVCLRLREEMLKEDVFSELRELEGLRATRSIERNVADNPTHDLSDYLRAMFRNHCELRFLGIPNLKDDQPLQFKDLFIQLNGNYIPTNVYRRPRRTRMTVNDEETVEIVDDVMSGDPFDPHLLPDSSASVNLVEELFKQERSIVLGGPGSGKSTLLKYLCLSFASLQASSDKDWLPIFVPLNEFPKEASKHEDYRLVDYFQSHAINSLGCKLPKTFFENHLGSKNCLVCLDGLDEVWDERDRDKVRNAVHMLVTHYPGNCFVISSRLVGYGTVKFDQKEFRHYRVSPLTNPQINEFIDKWYNLREPDAAERTRNTKNLQERLFAANNKDVLELARNPLLLTMIALIHRKEAELPNQRVKLYSKIVEALLNTWDNVKDVDVDKEQPHYQKRESLLERLAYELHSQAGEARALRRIDEKDLERKLQSFLMQDKTLNYSEDPHGAEEQAKKLIQLVQARAGLLIEDGTGVFSFPHLTFQEYLAARHIDMKNRIKGVDVIWQEIEPNLHRPHWKEVNLLLLGLLTDEQADYIVEKILERGNKDTVFEPALHHHLFLVARILEDKVKVYNQTRNYIVKKLETIALSKSDHLNYKAGVALVNIATYDPDDKAFQAVKICLHQGLESVRLSVAGWVLASDVSSLEAIAILLDLLKSKYLVYRNQAAQLLLEHRPEVVTVTLLETLKSDLNDGARILLKHKPETAIPILLETFKSDTSNSGTRAAKLLLEYRPEEIIPVLLEILQSGTLYSRFEAAELLLGHRPEAAIPVLLEVLEGGISEQRYPAARLLLTHKPDRAITTLLDALKSNESYWQYEAAELLLGHRPEAAIPVLLEILQSSDWYWQLNAAELLLEYRPAEAIPVLLEMLKITGSYARERAAGLLLGHRPEAVIPVLLAMLKITTKSKHAAELLLEYRPAEAIPVLLEFLRSEDKGWHFEVAKSLMKYVEINNL